MMSAAGLNTRAKIVCRSSSVSVPEIASNPRTRSIIHTDSSRTCENARAASGLRSVAFDQLSCLGHDR